MSTGKALIACVQMNSTDSVRDNLSRVEHWVKQSADAGAKLVILPESFAFMGKTMVLQHEYAEMYGNGPIQTALQNMAKQYAIWIVAGTLSLRVDQSDKLAAACLVYDDQGVEVVRYDKIHLFDVDVPDTEETYLESSVYRPGNQVVVIDSPVGKLGIAICYDVRFPELFRQQLEQGMQVLALPAAFTHATGLAHWHTLLRARAIENLCFVAAAAQTGVHVGERKTYGHSIAYNAWGEVLGGLAEEEGVALAEIDLASQQQLRSQFPALNNRRL